MRTKVLFVSMGGLCRAPGAAGVLRHMLQEADLSETITVDSVATHNYHLGEAPDGRVQFVCRRRGYDLSDMRVRQITLDDFRDYDMILATDWENLSYMQQICPRPLHHKLMLL